MVLFPVSNFSYWMVYIHFTKKRNQTFCPSSLGLVTLLIWMRADQDIDPCHLMYFKSIILWNMKKHTNYWQPKIIIGPRSGNNVQIGSRHNQAYLHPCRWDPEGDYARIWNPKSGYQQWSRIPGRSRRLHCSPKKKKTGKAVEKQTVISTWYLIFFCNIFS